MEDFELSEQEPKQKRAAPKTAWVKGQSGNPYGRPKGSKNKATTEIREYIQKIVSGQIENLDQDLDKMSDFNRWLIIEKIIKYFMPSLTKTELGGEVNSNIEIKVSYEDKPIDESNKTESYE